VLDLDDTLIHALDESKVYSSTDLKNSEIK